MDLRRIEIGNSKSGTVRQNQWQLGTTQDQRLNAIFIAQAFGDFQQAVACFRKKLAWDQLIQVLVMNIISLSGSGNSQRNALPRKHLRIKAAFHGKARPKQAQLSE